MLRLQQLHFLNTMSGPVDELPVELLTIFAAHLKPADIWRAQRTSKRWRQALTEKHIFRTAIQSYAAHHSSDSIDKVAPLEVHVIHMLNHCAGTPYGVVELLLTQLGLRQPEQNHASAERSTIRIS